jgi:hypothetical protein
LEKDIIACNFGMKTKIKKVKGVEYSMGSYRLDEKKNTVIITELPIKVWNKSFTHGGGDEKKKGAGTGGGAGSGAGVKNKELVDRCADDSSKTDINIKIKLKPGALAEIKEKYGDANFDPIESYFNLKRSLKSNINLIGLDTTVTEYKSYKDVFVDWFAIRKKYYKMRADRTRLMLMLEILYLENIIRYINNRHKYKLNEISEEAQEKLLSEFQRFNKSVFDSPPLNTKTEDLKEMILSGPRATHHYLLILNPTQMTVAKNKAREEELQKLKDTLKALNSVKEKFVGASIWEKELDELEAIIKKGKQGGWNFGETKPKWN